MVQFHWLFLLEFEKNNLLQKCEQVTNDVNIKINCNIEQ